MLKTSDLHFTYPESLVGTEPQAQFRALYTKNGRVEELQRRELFELFQPGDSFVINETAVLKRRIFTASGLEILFLEALPNNQWSVLFPARKVKDSDVIELPEGVTMKLVERGLPQKVQLNGNVDEGYFQRVGDLALPPYIQKARNSRRMRPEDEQWYQTEWAKAPGSSAAPTASLHFTNEDLENLAHQGVNIVPLTLHVGLGTFLPVKTENLNEHKMHSEPVEISKESLAQIEATKSSGHKIWALGTTVARSLESWAHGKLESTASGGVSGDTDLFITPGFKYKVVDRLMTNFHQPESTLLALVMAFAGKEQVLKSYDWAIKREFKLFSYGHLSVWEKEEV